MSNAGKRNKNKENRVTNSAEKRTKLFLFFYINKKTFPNIFIDNTKNIFVFLFSNCRKTLLLLFNKNLEQLNFSLPNFMKVSFDF